MRTHKEGALQGHRTQCESILITHYEDVCPIRMHIENSLCKGSIEYEQNNDIDIYVFIAIKYTGLPTKDETAVNPEHKETDSRKIRTM